jgi:class 3 adenylate cyclase/tetratricopeptide (TPR) repeat protein
MSTPAVSVVAASSAAKACINSRTMLDCPVCGHTNVEGAKFCNECAAPLTAQAPAGREQRKTVTVLFCDVTGSTELGERLDPEALRVLLARYFERMKAIIERHGGTVEKFIGDAVMAVFGVPIVHEDDALRALRAAVEMRAALPELGVQGRIGVTTGEVVTGTEERLATGDAVNVAARLEQAAQPGEILVGDETLQLTRDAATVEQVQPLSLKGKAEPVVVHRLLSVSGGEGFTRRHTGAMVGREREQRLLASTWERVVSELACQLFTILGPAGVGKSRLVAEFLALRDDAAIVRGRCLPYGEGITYWPVVEVVKQLEQMDVVGGETIRALASDEQVVTSSEEIAWDFRKLLESAAASRPLVCVFDDLQWGEETFLGLVEHVADLSRDAPILLLCMARPELLDRRPGWGGGKVNAASVLLEPLDSAETDRLIESLADFDPALRERIREAAEGNPLFVEEMVAMVKDSPDGDVTVPPTIQALLAARLDQLDAAEREVLQCGSVEGRVFHRGAVSVLASDEPPVTGRLTALVRKELVRPDRPQLPGDDAFRFRHLLIRDTAYDALPKSTRADLHEQFAGWLEEHGASLVEQDEIVAYHLERAVGYRQELGVEEQELESLAVRAGERLEAAAQRALARSDTPAAVNLLERATRSLASDPSRRRTLLPVLGRTLIQAGELERAERVLTEAVEDGKAAGEDRVAADALIGLSDLRLHSDPTTTHAQVTGQLAEAVRVLESYGDDAAIARAVDLSGRLLFWQGRSEAGLLEGERAVRHARKAGDRAQELEILRFMIAMSFHGPTPVADVLRQIEALEEPDPGHSILKVNMLRLRGELEAMQGAFDTGRALVGEARAVATGLGLTIMLATGVAHSAGDIELLAGDPVRAEQELRQGCENLEKIGDWGHLVTLIPYLADALLAQGRGQEAAPMIDRAFENVLEDDADPQIALRRVRARLLAEQGDLEEAERVGRESVARAEATDFLTVRGLALSDLAEVLALAGKPADAVDAFEQAVATYERKGNSVMASRTRARLAEILAG